ncbi:MAG TPA: SxtJ family membrane protein [Gemmatimonadaceae bacterium]|nr:SxtJ family membrane protein [Gemmatimonadaceae bacterium]
MAPTTSARLTREQGMKFAFTLAAPVSVLSAVLAWRQRTLGAEIMFVVGGTLLIAGLLVPTRLGPLERGWMAFGGLLSRITGPIVLAVIYYVALTPIAYLRRTFGRSPLARDPSAPSYWIHRPARDAEERRRANERQF